jgi:hypothetical protein
VDEGIVLRQGWRFSSPEQREIRRRCHDGYKQGNEREDVELRSSDVFVLRYPRFEFRKEVGAWEGWVICHTR